ncbi:hypothetical protein [Dolichospermum planctonicum]|uniref:Uncharacterized protein n=1 Tax=Dolichospermum planctonicum TaxID=136072 RepID=A0A480AEL0_9CYAN|nr:hypothetical protein [Dolichospermum planctonicum]GCL43417.1 hypothetical protein NIES80_31310 [Dolichospermum planctonicum]
MSLDITFYSKNGEASDTIEFSEQFYEKLIKSDFTEIGASHKIKIKVDEEEQEIEAIDLNKGIITNRQRLIDFFKEKIVEESKNMIEKLGDAPSKDEYEKQSYSLKKFHEILASVEDKKYDYLERVT